jgi:hypothetical protein
MHATSRRTLAAALRHYSIAVRQQWYPQREQDRNAIRLAVEGGGQVKAELVAVGQSGEQSLKRQRERRRARLGRAEGPWRSSRAAAHRHPHARWRADRGHDGRRPRSPGRPLDLDGRCHRQDRGQDRRRCRGPAAAALRSEGVGRRAADARHGAAALHPARGGGGAGHRRGEGRACLRRWASRCTTREDRARTSWVRSRPDSSQAVAGPTDRSRIRGRTRSRPWRFRSPWSDRCKSEKFRSAFW